MHEMILILDFGSQYTQLIARRVREMNVYCEIHPWNKCPELTPNVKGVILSGSPFSTRDENAPSPDLSLIKGKIPLLGVCFGAQFLANNYGGEVLPSTIREYGRANLSFVDVSNRLTKGMSTGSQVWMSHGDTIKLVPDNYKIVASTHDVNVAGYEIDGEDTFGIQFHPEVYHSLEGTILLRNFIVEICKCSQDWTPQSFVEETVAQLKEQIGSDKVILGLSGGVDSSVAAVLLHKAIGSNLHCIFVDNGLLRKNEYASVLESYKGMGLNVKGVDASAKFYAELKGLTDPELKRKAIGKVFVDVFDEESKLITDAKWLGQGTIYPDVIESVSVSGGPSQTIKSHHNVGGLPETVQHGITGHVCPAPHAPGALDSWVQALTSVLGEPHKGFEVANSWLGATRLQVASTCLGRAERALGHAITYAAERKQFGQQIGKFQGISFKLADMAMELKAAELLTREAAWKYDQGSVTEADMSMAKLKATEVLAMIADEAIQIHGGMGLMDDLPLERIWRDARVERIWEGTSEIQRHIISRELLRPLLR